MLSLPQMLSGPALDLTLGELLMLKLAPLSLIWSLAARRFCPRGRRWKIHGSGVSVPKPLRHQLLVRVRLEQLSASLMLLRWGTCSMWLSMRSLGSLVAVGQVPGKARRSNHQRVLVSQRRSFLFPGRPLVVLHLSLLFRKALRSRGRGEVVAIAAMPQHSKGDTSDNITVYLYKLLKFRILLIVWIYLA